MYTFHLLSDTWQTFEGGLQEIETRREVFARLSVYVSSFWPLAPVSR